MNCFRFLRSLQVFGQYLRFGSFSAIITILSWNFHSFSLNTLIYQSLFRLFTIPVRTANLLIVRLLNLHALLNTEESAGKAWSFFFEKQKKRSRSAARLMPHHIWRFPETLRLAHPFDWSSTREIAYDHRHSRQKRSISSERKLCVARKLNILEAWPLSATFERASRSSNQKDLFKLRNLFHLISSLSFQICEKSNIKSSVKSSEQDRSRALLPNRVHARETEGQASGVQGQTGASDEPAAEASAGKTER